MNGADLANMVNEAALFAAGKGATKVGEAEFEAARDKVLMGVARETLVVPEKEKRMTAFHEAGHALPHYYLEHVSPLHKVTIIPRGRGTGADGEFAVGGFVHADVVRGPARDTVRRIRGGNAGVRRHDDRRSERHSAGD
jgi:ATP-dependent Zn protease